LLIVALAALWQAVTAKDVVLLVLSSVLALGLALLSIHYSGVTLAEFHNFRRLGIVSADADFGLRDYQRDHFFASLVRGARREIILCGSTLSGWFQRSDDHINDFIDRLNNDVKITLLFLDPKSTNFRDRLSSEGEEPAKRLDHRLASSLSRLNTNWEKLESFVRDSRLKIYIYQNEPLSIVIFDDEVYWFTYLPTVRNQESPNLVLRRGGVFADKVCAPVLAIVEACEQSGARIKDKEQLRGLLETLGAGT
jgi:hypothetical protein